MKKSGQKVLTICGTPPEVIKLALVIRQFEAHGKAFQTVDVISAQHTHLLYPFISLFELRIDHDLNMREPNQTPNQVCSRMLSALDPILVQKKPGFFVVQGDTTTANAGALAGFDRRIPVGHVEAGLRRGLGRARTVSALPQPADGCRLTRCR